MNKPIEKGRLLLALLLILPSAGLLGQLSPGKLHQGHAHLEGIKNCTRCHSAKKQIDAEKCLACHMLLKERIDRGQGLHAQVGHLRCQTCHVEHHGRDFSLIRWPGDNPKKFDHIQGGFELKGRHTTLDCRQCHRAQFIQKKQVLRDAGKDLERTYLGLESTCFSCHPDLHRGQFNRPCTDCHTEHSWKPADKFSHDKTDFPLAGKHRTAACDSCHKIAADDAGRYMQYTGTSHGQCSACHVDVHQNRLGGQCSSCHHPSGWDRIPEGRFSHDMTRFPLRGRHREKACTACHTKGRKSPVEKFGHCTDCHADGHAGQFSQRPGGGACEDCHTEEGFTPSTFTLNDHEATHFPLTGSHLAVPCIDCHQPRSTGGRQFRFNSMTCQDCHDDIHQGQVNRMLTSASPQTGQAGCQHCHNTESWNQITFDHSRTSFPLEGRHQWAGCSDCHYDKAGRKWLFADQSAECQTCHEDIHRGQFSEARSPSLTRCDRCHTATDWLAEKFNHNRDSDFPLSGRHSTLTCNACHKTETKGGKTLIRYKPMGKRCDDCHVDRSK